MAYKPQGNYPPAPQGTVTDPYEPVGKSIGIDGKMHQFLDERIDSVKRDNPQIGDTVEYRLSKDKELARKGKISFFKILTRKNPPVESSSAPANPPPVSAHVPPGRPAIDLECEYISKSSTTVTIKTLDGVTTSFPADLSVIKTLIGPPQPIQTGQKFTVHLVPMTGSGYAISRIGPAGQGGITDLPIFQTAKELLQQNLDAKRAADAAAAKPAEPDPAKSPTEPQKPLPASQPEKTPTDQQKPVETAPAAPQNQPGTAPQDPVDEIELFKTTMRSIPRDGIEELLSWLENETDFYIAPSSTHFHDAVAGGLLHHSLKVLEYLNRLAPIFKVEIPPESLTLIALMHDLCKVNFYALERKELPKKDENGDLILDDWGKKIWEPHMIYTVKDQFPLGHGEKSVILLQRFIKLTDLEIMAIRWHMMAYDDLHYSYAGNYAITGASDKFRIIPLVHIADLSASFLEMNPEVPPESPEDAGETAS